MGELRWSADRFQGRLCGLKSIAISMNPMWNFMSTTYSSSGDRPMMEFKSDAPDRDPANLRARAKRGESFIVTCKTK